MYYTVKEVADKTGLSSYTIRYYLSEGLFPNIHRNKNGTRLFSDNDLEAFYIIDCLKKCGMSIIEIRQYMEWLKNADENIDNCLELFIEKYQALMVEKRNLEEYIDTVKYKIWYYQTAKEAKTVDIHKRMDEKDIPVKMQRIHKRMIDLKRLKNKNLSK